MNNEDITTAEELAALPVGAVVLSRSYDYFPTAFQQRGDGYWYRCGRSRDTHPDYIIPALVLYPRATR